MSASVYEGGALYGEKTSLCEGTNLGRQKQNVTSAVTRLPNRGEEQKMMVKISKGDYRRFS